jgi:hypothetical protein
MSNTSKTTTRRNRARRIATMAAVPVLGAGLGLALAAGPASAAPTCTPPGSNGCVGSSLTIPSSFTLTVTTASMSFTGTPGGPSNVQTVLYNVVTNDPGGYTVAVLGTDLTGAKYSAHLPVGDFDVWGQAQTDSRFGTAPATGFLPAPLSASAKVITTSTTAPSASSGDNWTDTYAILSSSSPVNDELGHVPPTAGSGTNIPVLPPDTYSGTVQYSGIGS